LALFLLAYEASMAFLHLAAMGYGCVELESHCIREEEKRMNKECRNPFCENVFLADIHELKKTAQGFPSNFFGKEMFFQ
jgi:hypothetical protein